MLGRRRVQKDMYRHMKIKTVKGMDDYSMIEEITGRVIKISVKNFRHS